jgi:hypothetical protein
MRVVISYADMSRQQFAVRWATKVPMAASTRSASQRRSPKRTEFEVSQMLQAGCKHWSRSVRAHYSAKDRVLSLPGGSV